MNYYSRNSPVKKRNKKTDPGFLLQHPYSYFTHHSSRAPSRLTSRSYSSTPNYDHLSQASMQPPQSINTSHQILILQSDDLSSDRSQNNEILIIEDETEQLQEDVDEFGEYPQQKESASLQSIGQVSSEQDQSNSIAVSERRQKQSTYEQKWSPHSSNAFSKQSKDDLDSDNQYQKQKPIQQQIPRNYSFGNADEIFELADSDSNQSTIFINPLLRKLFDPKIIEEISETSSHEMIQSKESAKKKQAKRDLKQKQLSKQKISEQKKVEQQNWELYLQIFRKKRKNKRKSTPENSEKEESETGEQNSDHLNQKKQEVSSQQSGYFNLQQPQHNFKTQPAKEPEIVIQRKIQQELAQVSKQTIKKQPQPYSHSLNLLTQSFSQLPHNLLGPFLKIHEQLIRKQRDLRRITKKQKQTMQMMENLIDSHHKLLYVDDFLLSEHSECEEQQMAANQEIIFSLIRKISLQL